MSPNAVTCYCGRPHRLEDGVPVGHRCRILPPNFLRLEQEADFFNSAEFEKCCEEFERLPVVLHDGVPD